MYCIPSTLFSPTPLSLSPSSFSSGSFCSHSSAPAPPPTQDHHRFAGNQALLGTQSPPHSSFFSDPIFSPSSNSRTSNMDLNLSTINSQQSKHGFKAFIFPQCKTTITTKNKEIIILVVKFFCIIIFYPLKMEKGRMQKVKKTTFLI